MAVSDVSICNSALIKVGAERITSLDDSNPRARLLKECFERKRDELLYSHPWNFAIKQEELALISEAPQFDFSYQFQLPNDCLRVVDSDIPKPGRWKVEGRKLLCDYATVSVRFVSNATDYADYSPAFVEALGASIAADISYSLVQNAALKETLLKDAEMKIRLARSFDAQESVGDRVYADSWLNSRY